MKCEDKIYITGYTGFAGSRIAGTFGLTGFINPVYRNSGADLKNRPPVQKEIDEDPAFAFSAAGKVARVANNSHQARLFHNNLVVISNAIYASGNCVKHLPITGNPYIYPKEAFQSIKEKYHLTGPLEQANRPYVAAIKLPETFSKKYRDNFTRVMPTNLYGINDTFTCFTTTYLQSL